MKLLYLHDSDVASEKANIIQALHMCYAFSVAGVNVILAVPDRGYSLDSIKDSIMYKMNKELIFSIITYPKVTVMGRFSLIGGFLGVRKIIKEENTDYCFLRNPIFLNVTVKSNIPTVFESHNSLLHNKYKTFDLILRKNLIKNSKSDKLIKFITISSALAEIWKSRGVPGEKIITLHDGVDSNSVATIPNQQKLRKRLNLPLQRKIVLYAGSLYPNRGIENILKLAKLFPQALFLILGGPVERRSFYIEASRDHNINNILFLGYIPHHRVKDYLFAADVLLMIWTEKVKTINFCSPLKMFEYMASGRIIVGHSFPTIREILTDKKNAYLADPNSFENLQMKLRLALKQRYPNSIAQEARRLVLSKYTWKARVQTILESIRC